MSRIFLVCTMMIALVVFIASSALGLSIDLTSGTTGTTFFNQSFNETRGVDVTIKGGQDLQVTAMTLEEFNITTTSGTVGARIYDSSTKNLLVSADQSVGFGFDQTITIPISMLLQDGNSYLLAFSISAPVGGGAADFFDPDPIGSNVLPYMDTTGYMQISQAFAGIPDAFPTNFNAYVPLITVTAAPVPEPTTWFLMCIGLVGLGLYRRFFSWLT